MLAPGMLAVIALIAGRLKMQNLIVTAVCPVCSGKMNVNVPEGQKFVGIWQSTGDKNLSWYKHKCPNNGCTVYVVTKKE